jgi:hypothetical protein
VLCQILACLERDDRMLRSLIMRQVEDLRSSLSSLESSGLDWRSCI